MILQHLKYTPYKQYLLQRATKDFLQQGKTGRLSGSPNGEYTTLKRPGFDSGPGRITCFCLSTLSQIMAKKHDMGTPCPINYHKLFYSYFLLINNHKDYSDTSLRLSRSAYNCVPHSNTTH